MLMLNPLYGELYLKQSTAVTVKLGPFLDDTDGKTPENALTLTQSDFRLSKNGGDMAQKNQSSNATFDEIGVYDVSLNTTDTNTIGRLRIDVLKSGALPVWKEFMVLDGNSYDRQVLGYEYTQDGRRILFVDKTTDGAGDTGTRAAPYDTIASAISGGAKNDVIFIIDGTYDEGSLEPKEGQILIGQSRTSTIISKSLVSSTSYVLKLSTGCQIHNLTVTANSDGWAIYCEDVHNIVLKNLKVNGQVDSLAVTQVIEGRIQNYLIDGCFFDATYDATGLGYIDGLTIRNSTFIARGTYAPTAVPQSIGLNVNLCNGSAENCYFASIIPSGGSNVAAGHKATAARIQGACTFTLKNCRLYAETLNSSHNGFVRALTVGNVLSNGAKVYAENCRYTSQKSGGSSVLSDIVSEGSPAGEAVVIGGYPDTAKVSGTVRIVDADTDETQSKLPAGTIAAIGDQMTLEDEAITSAKIAAGAIVKGSEATGWNDPTTAAINSAIEAGQVGLDAAAAKTAAEALPSAADIWDALTSGISTSGSIGKLIKDNLDAAISSIEVGSTTPRINYPAGPPYRLKASDLKDGTYGSNAPVRLAPGATDVAFSVDMRPLFGNVLVTSVGTPTVSGGSITAAALGPRDHEAMVQLSGTATASESRTVTFTVTMANGDTVTLKVSIIVTAA
ncbi:MAG: hypothetical protein DWQ31_16680 [Planctomycetota bacterium]|nr:MAG: hypothetical protein DWQ31_16680 [Planctomycetota bacterium]